MSLRPNITVGPPKVGYATTQRSFTDLFSDLQLRKRPQNIKGEETSLKYLSNLDKGT
jgi:hypothetical protein